MRKLCAAALAALLCLTLAGPARANSATVSNATELQAALATAQSGDTITLLGGSYGELVISGRVNTSTVSLRAADGATPVFTRIRIQNSRHWAVIGVDVRPRYTSGADGATAVVLDGDDLTLENSRINYADDITGWSAADWLARAGNGLSLEGARITVRNNIVSVVDHGINSSATDTLVSGNVIAHFRGDGIRGLGDDTIFEYNTIKNAYAVDDNHDDGFQSWSYGAGGVGTGVVRGVVLRGNTIINYEDPNQPHRGNLQGIGLFDGMFEDWVVENNLVITDHWHGISFYGAINVRVVNNTVVDNNTAPSPDPWIMIHDHKNGTPSTGTLVRNNIATDYSLDGGVTADHNLEITMAQAVTHFANPAGGTGDYHLLSSSPAVDAGSGASAPTRDRDGALRPQGATWDLGAYELAPAIELRGMSGDRVIQVDWSVNTTLPGNATWQVAYVGPAGAQASPIMGLPGATRAYTLTGLTNYAVYTVTVSAMVDGSAILTDTFTAMPSDRSLVLPALSK